MGSGFLPRLLFSTSAVKEDAPLSLIGRIQDGLPNLFTAEICETARYTFSTQYRSPQIPTKSSAKLKASFDGGQPCDRQ